MSFLVAIVVVFRVKMLKLTLDQLPVQVVAGYGIQWADVAVAGSGYYCRGGGRWP